MFKKIWEQFKDLTLTQIITTEIVEDQGQLLSDTFNAFLFCVYSRPRSPQEARGVNNEVELLLPCEFCQTLLTIYTFEHHQMLCEKNPNNNLTKQSERQVSTEVNEPTLSLHTVPARAPPPSQPVVSLNNKVKELESKIQKLEQQHQCAICYEREKGIVFTCGHSTCRQCSEQIQTCHICRKPIRTRLPLY
ncbi:unnamed protein product [Didymodactylos carnosus]|uniref:RING-type domain-containing protein n=1 Tax=Didymodactylos carnosus TaxID=1234261 RepID=A0A814Z4G9_9BILA|nr:unnamed protein product [Didymodactylos carnosus]CAF1238922.1 unnamed protein product [Didymodactylos carnosus]CAF3819530.1 unnamed protein product [Didymodactylos carnosus]CAF4001095.1 unnamed protein product [Didymodactylos carnosus]